MCEELRIMADRLPSFWHWFFRGSGARRGFRRLVNLWLFLHIAVGAAAAIFVAAPLSEVASAVLFPLAGVFVGLAFAWAVNSQALMASSEIEMMAAHHEGGFVEYVYTYQAAILTLLVTLLAWGVAGLKVFDCLGPDQCHDVLYFLAKLALFTLCSLSVRECWQVVDGTSRLLLSRREIRRASGQRESADSDTDDQ